jgi:hypothetical protein
MYISSSLQIAEGATVEGESSYLDVRQVVPVVRNKEAAIKIPIPTFVNKSDYAVQQFGSQRFVQHVFSHTLSKRRRTNATKETDLWDRYIDKATRVMSLPNLDLPPAIVLNDSWRKLGTSIQNTLGKNGYRACEKAILVLLRQRLAPLREERTYNARQKRREPSQDLQHTDRKESRLPVWARLHRLKRCLLRVGKANDGCDDPRGRFTLN